MNSDNGEERFELHNIMENYDDLKEIPPDYFKIMPENDPEVFENFPSIIIKIASSLNSNEKNIEDVLEKNKKLLTPVKAHKEMKARPTFTFRAMSALKKNQEKMKVEIEDEIDEEEEDNNKLLKVKDKYEQAIKDLASLCENYEKANMHIKYLLNQFQYIVSNHNLNEKNKKVKLVEFLNDFIKPFEKELAKFNTHQIEYFKLNQLKNEVYKFLKHEYEIICNYIVQSRFLSEYLNLDELKLK